MQKKEMIRKSIKKIKRSRKKSLNIRRTLKAHLTRIKELEPNELVRTRITRFLKYLTKLGEEKGEIDMDLFSEITNNIKILRFIIKKYGNQCEETVPIMLNATHVVATTKGLGPTLISAIKDVEIFNILKCMKAILSKPTKQFKPLIIMFGSVDRTDEYGHKCLLIINIDTREIVRIDPMGAVRNDGEFYYKETGVILTDRINKEFGLKDESEKYKYIDLADTTVVCPVNPQQKLLGLDSISVFIHKKVNRPTKLETKTCVLWSILFSELIIAYPESTYKDVLYILMSYIQHKPETTLYLIRGYFWYLRKDVFSDFKEESKLSKVVGVDGLEKLTKQITDYITLLETNNEEYSPLQFTIMYSKLQEVMNDIISSIATLDVTVKKAIDHTLSIYENLVERYQAIKTLIDNKKTPEENDLETELLFILFQPIGEIKNKYGVDLLDNFQDLETKIQNNDNSAKSERYKAFYSQATDAIQSIRSRIIQEKIMTRRQRQQPRLSSEETPDD